MMPGGAAIGMSGARRPAAERQSLAVDGIGYGRSNWPRGYHTLLSQGETIMTRLISRRRVLVGASNVVGAGTLLAGLPLRAFAQAPKPITVGFIYAATR